MSGNPRKISKEDLPSRIRKDSFREDLPSRIRKDSIRDQADNDSNTLTPQERRQRSLEYAKSIRERTAKVKQQTDENTKSDKNKIATKVSKKNNGIQRDTTKFRGTVEEESKKRNVTAIIKAINKKDDEHYIIRHNKDSKKNKKIVIFSHNNYSNGQNSRPGNIQDVKRIINLFEEKLNYDIEIFEDLPSHDIFEAIQKLSEEDHSERDILITFVLTHGNERYLYAENKSYEPSILWENFEAGKCKTLAGKPKIFIINACHGSGVETGFRMVETDGSQGVSSYVLPSHADFLVARSSVQGYYTYRDPEKGSIFIQTFCDVVEDYCKSKHLLEILQITMRKVATNSIGEDEVLDPQQQVNLQMPFVTTRLIRNVYLAEQTE